MHIMTMTDTRWTQPSTCFWFLYNCSSSFSLLVPSRMNKCWSEEAIMMHTDDDDSSHMLQDHHIINTWRVHNSSSQQMVKLWLRINIAITTDGHTMIGWVLYVVIRFLLCACNASYSITITLLGTSNDNNSNAND